MDAPVGHLPFSVSEDTDACVQLLSCVQLFAAPGTAACQAPLSMGFPSKNMGVSSHFLLQGSTQPRDGTHVSCVSCIAGGFFTAEHWGSPYHDGALSNTAGVRVYKK